MQLCNCARESHIGIHTQRGNWIALAAAAAERGNLSTAYTVQQFQMGLEGGPWISRLFVSAIEYTLCAVAGCDLRFELKSILDYVVRSN